MPGSISGEFSVGRNGDAQYRIPISIPTGAGGLKPQLALEYSSNRGAGLAGQGWELSGVGSVARCRQTLAQDGKVVGVTNSSSDRFCLNGQRLILIAGNYGAPGSEYRTEIDRFYKLTAKGLAGTGPQSFTVQHPDGVTYFYGSDGDSRLMDAGGTVKEWGLNRIEDKFGNSINIHYETATESSGNETEYVPKNISYSDPSFPPQYLVIFEYEDRPARDYRSGYLAGTLWERSKRLKTIKTHHDLLPGALNYRLIHSYALDYETELANGTGRSRLASLTQCGPTDCLPSTEFAWQHGEAGWGAPAGTVPGYEKNFRQFGDFNRDGKIDLLGAAGLNDPWLVHYSNGSGFGPGHPTGAILWEYGLGGYAGWGHFTIVTDYNGDGRDDQMHALSGSIGQLELQVAQTNSAGGFDPIAVGSPQINGPVGPLSADLDADGLDDLVLNNSWHLNISDQPGQSYGAANPIVVPPGMDQIAFDSIFSSSISMGIEIDGDGKADVVIPYLNTAGDRYWYAVDLLAGEATYLHMFALDDGSSYSASPVALDANGDHLTDFLVHRKGDITWSLVISTGNAFMEPVPTPITYFAKGIPDPGIQYPEGIRAVDFDLDGRSDVLNIDNGNVYRSRGDSFEVSPVFSFSPLLEEVTPADVNGDGNMDLVATDDGLGCAACGILLHNGLKADLLTMVTDGVGKAFAPAYVSVSNATGAEYSYSWEYPYPGDRTVRDARHVVRSYAASDGIGGTYTKSFKYGNGRQNMHGRGFLGFFRKQETDSRSGIVIKTLYETAFPFSGRIRAQTTYQSAGGAEIRIYDPEWDSIETYPGVEFVFLDAAVTEEYEVGGINNGELVRTTSVDHSYNTTYGYRTQTETQVARADIPYWPHLTTEIITPYNDSLGESWWCLGLPARVDITRQNAFPPAETRSITFADYEADCKPRTITEGANEVASQQLVTTLTYDTIGNIATRSQDDADSATSAAPRISVFDHDGWGNRVSSEQRVMPGEDNHELIRSWDDRFGLESALTDINGHTTQTSYDEFGRVRILTGPDGATSTNDYQRCTAISCNASLAAYRVTNNNSDGSYSYAEFDSYGRELGIYTALTAAQTAESFVVRSYDNRGRLAALSAPGIMGELPINTFYSYDELNRVIQEIRPINDGNEFTTIVKSYEKWIKRKTRDSDTPLVSDHDGLGRVIRVTDAAGATSFGYTAFDELAKVWDVQNNLTTIGYNNRGFRTSLNDPDSGYWSYQYNAFGEVRLQTDDRPASPQVMEQRYDQLGRMTQRLEEEGATNWEYFPNTGPTKIHKRGLLARVSIVSGSTELFAESYDYDLLSRQNNSITNIDGRDFVIDSTYDSESRLKTLTYPEAKQPFAGWRTTAVYSYDGTGYLDRVDFGINTVYQLLEVDGYGNETKAMLGNEYRRRSYFAATGRPKTIRSDLSDTGSGIQNLEYAWHARGNLKSREHLGTLDLAAAVSEDFYYDEDLGANSLDRLTSVRLNNAETLSVSYDSLGNITSKSDVGVLYRYGENNAGPHAVTSIDGELVPNSRTYSYDHNGNVLSREAVGNTLQWTSFNKPARIKYNGTELSFDYGPKRARYRQIDSSGKTIYYIGNLFQAEIEGSNVRSVANVFANGEAVYVNQLQGFSAPGGWLNEWYVHRDYLGSIDTLTNGNGNVLERFSYDSFGKRRNPDWSADATDLLLSSAHATERGYTSHEHLDAVKLIHMNGRVQDPVIGRFLSADPVVPSLDAPQGLNRYSYVYNNPLTFSDPSGFSGCGDSRVQACKLPEIISRGKRLKGLSTQDQISAKSVINYFSSFYKINAHAAFVDAFNSWSIDFAASGNMDPYWKLSLPDSIDTETVLEAFEEAGFHQVNDAGGRGGALLEGINNSLLDSGLLKRQSEIRSALYGIQGLYIGVKEVDSYGEVFIRGTLYHDGGTGTVRVPLFHSVSPIVLPHGQPMNRGRPFMKPLGHYEFYNWGVIPLTNKGAPLPIP